jgi:hypothetical protein
MLPALTVTVLVIPLIRKIQILTMARCLVIRNSPMSISVLAPANLAVLATVSQIRPITVIGKITLQVSPVIRILPSLMIRTRVIFHRLISLIYPITFLNMMLMVIETSIYMLSILTARTMLEATNYLLFI